MDLKTVALNMDLVASTARWQTELKELFQRSRSDFDSLTAQVRGEFVKVRSEITEAATGMGFRPRDSKPKDLIDSRDYKVSHMPENRTTEQFNKWRHDAVVFLEARPKWKSAKKVLHLPRKATKVIDDGAMLAAINEANRESRSECGSNIVETVGECHFLDWSRELYQL